MQVEPPCPAEGKVQQDLIISEKHKTFVSWAHGKAATAPSANKDR